MNPSRTLSVILDLQDNISEDLKKVGSSVNGLKKPFLALAGVATTAATVIKGAMVASAFDIDRANSIIVRGTGASGDELANMLEQARRVGRGVPQNLEQVASTLAEVNTRFDAAGDSLENITNDMLNFARVTGMEGVGATRQISRLMGDWGVPLEDSTKLLDQLVVAGQKSGISIQDLTETAVNYGVQMRAFGLEQEQVIALLSKWEKEGVSTQKMVGGLSMALGRLAEDNDDVAGAFTELIDELGAFEQEGEAVRRAIEVLGTRAGPDFALAVREGRFEIDDYTEALKNAGGSLESTAENSLTLGERMSMLRQRVFDSLSPTGDLTDQISGLLDRMLDWVENNQHVIRSITDLVDRGFSLLTSAIRFFIEIFQQVIERVRPFIPLLQRMTEAVVDISRKILAELKPAFDAFIKAIEPMLPTLKGLAVIFGVLLVGAIVIFSSAIGALAVFVLKMFTNIVNIIGGAFNVIRGLFEMIAGFFVGVITGDWQLLHDGAKRIVDGVVAVFKGLWESVKAIFTGIWDFLVNIWQSLYTILVGNSIIPDMVDAIINVFNIFGDRAKQIFTSIWDGLTSIVRTAAETMMSVIDGILRAIERVREGASAIGANVGSRVSSAFSSVASFLPSRSVNDAIISPKGDIITTHPDDYIIATKTPGSLGGGNGVTVNVYGDVSGRDLIETVKRGIIGELKHNIKLTNTAY